MIKKIEVRENFTRDLGEDVEMFEVHYSAQDLLESGLLVLGPIDDLQVIDEGLLVKLLGSRELLESILEGDPDHLDLEDIEGEDLEDEEDLELEDLDDEEGLDLEDEEDIDDLDLEDEEELEDEDLLDDEEELEEDLYLYEGDEEELEDEEDWDDDEEDLEDEEEDLDDDDDDEDLDLEDEEDWDDEEDLEDEEEDLDDLEDEENVLTFEGDDEKSPDMDCSCLCTTEEGLEQTPQDEVEMLESLLRRFEANRI
ncbi:MAG: hypothetical protein QXP51_05160 [Candidatus Hadarchaeales archaeon]